MKSQSLQYPYHKLTQLDEEDVVDCEVVVVDVEVYEDEDKEEEDEDDDDAICIVFFTVESGRVTRCVVVVVLAEVVMAVLVLANVVLGMFDLAEVSSSAFCSSS